MKKILLCLFICCNFYGAEQSEESSITINIKTIKQEIPLSCQPHTTIGDLKQALFNSEGVPVAQQRLVKPASWMMWFKSLGTAQSVTLQDNKTCVDYNLGHNSTVQLYVSFPHNQR